jgi:hypothetical protein
MKKELCWPRQGGSSLILVMLDERGMAPSALHAELVRIALEFDVDVGIGIDKCDALVQSGIASLSWLNGKAIFVFRCPSDLAVWEAAPLLDFGLLTDELAKASETLLMACATAALHGSSRIAFVAAHEWRPGDRIRFESGTLAEFRSFVRSPCAWSTQYLGLGNAYVVNLDNESPFWYEIRR